MLKLWKASLILLLLGGCALFEPERVGRAPAVGGDPARCLAELRATGTKFEEMADFATPDGCRVVNAVKLLKLGADLNRPAAMACPLALSLARFEASAMQPLARQYLGQNVRKIHHVGAYDCRKQRNGKQISQHGLGQAIDFWAFELNDGAILKVRDDWKTSGARGAFLRKLSEQACNHFHLVLTPASDYDHHDHIHVDLGPWMRCG
ncbi:Protein conserved in bacteria [Rhodospirillaceae bacterium LM-1]|nr:Protein conserved in bacteria [Rhodospirillaceae bacterium LM-1]